VGLLKRFGDSGPNQGQNGRQPPSGRSGSTPGALEPSARTPAPGESGVGQYGSPDGAGQGNRTSFLGGAGPGALARENNFYDIKAKVQSALIAELDPKLDLSQTAQVRRTIEELFGVVLSQQGINLSRADRRRYWASGRLSRY